MEAAANNNVEALKLMINHPRINVNAKDFDGWTAVTHAAAKCSIVALKLLINDPRVDLDTENNRQQGLEDLVGAKRSKDMCEMIKEKKKKRNMAKEIMLAICEDDMEKIRLLESIDAQTANETDSKFQTCLHSACRRNNWEAVSKLLAIPGIEVNARNSKGSTPVMLAAAKGRTESFKLMLEDPRVDLNPRDSYGDTTITIAATENMEALSLMIKNPRVDINARSECGYTGIMYAIALCECEAVKLLLNDPRVDLDVRDKRGRPLEEMVGVQNVKSTKKPVILEMIKEERRKREDAVLEHGQDAQKENMLSANNQQVRIVTPKFGQ